MSEQPRPFPVGTAVEIVPYRRANEGGRKASRWAGRTGVVVGLSGGRTPTFGVKDARCVKIDGWGQAVWFPVAALRLPADAPQEEDR